MRSWWLKLKKKPESEQALGRSRGGFSSKIHITVDALGNPLKIILTGGERNDITQAEALIEPFEFDNLLADKGYDANKLLKQVEEKQAKAVIPPKANRKIQREYDTELYKDRNLVERFINKIKWYRRIFTRYDKLMTRYKAFLHFVSVLIWLR